MFYRPVRFNVEPSLAATTAAAQADAKAREAKTEVELLRCDIERLLMINEALWEILKEKFGYDDAELTRRVTEIDQRDGRLDGRVLPEPPSACPKCGRVLERKRPMCLYCGQLIERDPFER